METWKPDGRSNLPGFQRLQWNGATFKAKPQSKTFQTTKCWTVFDLFLLVLMLKKKLSFGGGEGGQDGGTFKLNFFL